MTDIAGLYAAPEPKGRVLWCGPVAIAAATGVSPAKVENTIVRLRATMRKPMRRERNMRGAKVKFMWQSEIEPICRALGFDALPVKIKGRGRRLTYKSLTELMQAGALKGPIIALFTGHYIALSQWHFVDSDNNTPQVHTSYYRPRHCTCRLWLIRRRRRRGLDSKPRAVRKAAKLVTAKGMTR